MSLRIFVFFCTHPKKQSFVFVSKGFILQIFALFLNFFTNCLISKSEFTIFFLNNNSLVQLNFIKDSLSSPSSMTNETLQKS